MTENIRQPEPITHIGSGVPVYDFIRCNTPGCGFLDRSDFITKRGAKLGRGCRKCGGYTFKEPTGVTKPEVARMRKGFYDNPEY